MENQKKWLIVIAAAAVVLVGGMTALVLALKKPKDASGGVDPSAAQEAGAQASASAEEPGKTAPSSEGSENIGPADAPGMPESLMDVVCGASGIAAMEDGSLIVTDTYNKVLWQVQSGDGGSIIYAGGETVADIYGEPVGGYNDAGLSESYFQTPWAVAPFLNGWAVSDTGNNVIRLVAMDKVQTVNGITTEKLTVKDLGVVFDHPTGLAADGDGNLYVSDTNSGAVRKITPGGKVSTVVSKLEEPMGLCWKDGVLYVAETGANRVVKIVNGKTEIVAGSGENGYADGEAADATFAFPQGIAVGDDGTVYVADTGNSAVRVVKGGKVETLLSRDRTSLELSPVSPIGVLVQGKELYICDNFARKVLRVTGR